MQACIPAPGSVQFSVVIWGEGGSLGKKARKTVQCFDCNEVLCDDNDNLEKFPPATNCENTVSILSQGYFIKHHWGVGSAQRRMQDHANPSCLFPPIFPRFFFL